MADDAENIVNDGENSIAGGGVAVKGTGVDVLTALVRRLISYSIGFWGKAPVSNLKWQIYLHISTPIGR